MTYFELITKMKKKQKKTNKQKSKERKKYTTKPIKKHPDGNHL